MTLVSPSANHGDLPGAARLYGGRVIPDLLSADLPGTPASNTGHAGRARTRDIPATGPGSAARLDPRHAGPGGHPRNEGR